MEIGMIKIKIIDPQKPDQLQEVNLKPETMLNQECLIGRFSNCDLVLDGVEVSRKHGKIFKKNGNYYFADLGSSGGSRFNGENAQANQDYLLQSHSMIHIGKFFLMILQIESEEDITVIEPLQKTEPAQPTIQEIPKEPPSQTNGQAIPREAASTRTVSPQEYMPLAMVEPSQLERWSKGELTVQCIAITDETHDVKTFRFVANPPVLFTYKPGQFATLDLEINGEQISRSYSISSTPSRPHTLEITVKRVPSPPNAEAEVPRGLVSNWLHDNVKVGSEIKLSGPLGKFTCFTNPNQKLLLISAGSGITPMMSMSRWLTDTGANCDIVFFHCARSPRDIIFRQELEMMSARYPNFRLAVSTTRNEPGHSWLSLTGRLDAAMLKVVAPDYRERTVYVCGPDTFMASTQQMLESIDFPMQNYYEESFGPPRKKSKSADPQQQAVSSSTATSVTPPQQHGLKHMFSQLSTQTTPELKVGSSVPAIAPVTIQNHTQPKSTSKSELCVVFSKSGKEVSCDGEEPILNLAEQEGVKIRNSCRAGVCGSCKKRKLEGEVRMEGEPEGLEESERQEGYILTCISYPLGRVVIDA